MTDSYSKIVPVPTENGVDESGRGILHVQGKLPEETVERLKQHIDEQLKGPGLPTGFKTGTRIEQWFTEEFLCPLA